MLKKGTKIDKGFELAKKITKKNAKSFYFASILLNSQKKKGAYAIYAICRISDDSVDNNEKNQKKKLEQIKNNINAAYLLQPLNSSLLSAFRATINFYNIPKKYFDYLNEGMEMDLEKNSYANYDQLYKYCYKVAGVVGLIMLYVLGFKNQNAKKYAIKLGTAMQLTNILRDIKEDFRRGRIYLPKDECKKFNISQDTLKKEIVDNNFVNFMKFQIGKARKLYQDSEKGIKLITGYRCRLTVYLMKNFYAAILDKIEENKYNIFKKRAYTSILDKILISLSTIFSFKYL
ncbi:MAG: phytoene/squalene synthase family protein [Candidatus Omnitrophica bacterium]|nr:phytoene/squalene synthase family protein [Candidatus Omnitrophota bacterium]MCF7898259.1 phytoene/squalene synthase family protein [Candidatus Omnitrophota bacterium]MCF7909148.1 phytoene/squalene synthase family protein [Candidatus Omnitrophota bacterium]